MSVYCQGGRGGGGGANLWYFTIVSVSYRRVEDIKGEPNRTEPRIHVIVQELCESRGGRPGLSVLTRLLVFVDVKLY